MAASVRSFSNLLKLDFPLVFVALSSRYIRKGPFSTIGIGRSFKQTPDHMQFMRSYHLAPPLGVKASVLSNDKPLEKADTGCPICSANVSFSYKDVLFLAQFLSPEGNLLNKRITGVCGKQQRKLEKAIKISRRLGLLPKCGPVNNTIQNKHN